MASKTSAALKPLTLRRLAASTASKLTSVWPLATLLLLNVLTHVAWLGLHGGIQTSGDTGVIPHAAQLQLGSNALSLQTGTGFSATDVIASYHPVDVAFAALAHLGVGYGWSLRLLYLWPFLVLSSCGAYFLAHQVLRSQPSVLVAGLVLQFNTYVLLLQGGELTLLMGAALLTCLTSVFLRLLREGATPWRLTRLLACGFVLSAFELRVFYLATFVTLFMACAFSARMRSIKPAAWWATLMAVVGGLNAYWILALGQSGSLTNNALTSRSIFGPQFFDLPAAINLFHRFWTGSATAIFVNQPLPPYFWVISVAAAAGFWIGRSRPEVRMFAVIAAVGVFLSKETAAPFGNIYQLLFDHFPGFSLFREAGKFYLLTGLGYAILIGVASDRIWRAREGSDRALGLSVFALTALALVFIYNAEPLVSGSFDTMFRTRQAPAAYTATDRLTYDDASGFRTLWAPVTSRWSAYDSDHPIISLGDAVSAWASVDFGGQTLQQLPNGASQLLRVVTSDVGHDLLDQASVRYVDVPTIDQANSDDVFGNDARSDYINALDRSPWLHRLSAPSAPVAVYENASWKPLVTVPNGTARQLSLSSFAVTVNDIRMPTVVTLGLPSDTGWRLVPTPGPVTDCPAEEAREVPLTHAIPGPRDIVGHTGQTLEQLADATGSSVAEISAANKLRLQAGRLAYAQRVVIPSPPVSTFAVTTCPAEHRQATSVGLHVGGLPPTVPAQADEQWMTAWTLSPAVIAQWPSSTWSRQADGSLTASFLVEYAPQASFDRGLLASGAVVLIATALCVALTLSRRRRVVAAFLNACATPAAAGVSPTVLASWLSPQKGETWRASTTQRLRRRRLRLRGARVGHRVTLGPHIRVTRGRGLQVGDDAVIGAGVLFVTRGDVLVGAGAFIDDGVTVVAAPERTGATALAIAAGAHISAPVVVADDNGTGR